MGNYRGKAFVTGCMYENIGCPNGNAHTELFDTSTMTWTQTTDYPFTPAGQDPMISLYATASTKDAVYVIGGATDTVLDNSLNIIAKFQEGLWQKTGELKQKRFGHSVITSGNKVLIVGGTTGWGSAGFSPDCEFIRKNVYWVLLKISWAFLWIRLLPKSGTWNIKSDEKSVNYHPKTIHGVPDFSSSILHTVLKSSSFSTHMFVHNKSKIFIGAFLKLCIELKCYGILVFKEHFKCQKHFEKSNAGHFLKMKIDKILFLVPSTLGWISENDQVVVRMLWIRSYAPYHMGHM